MFTIKIQNKEYASIWWNLRTRACCKHVRCDESFSPSTSLRLITHQHFMIYSLHQQTNFYSFISFDTVLLQTEENNTVTDTGCVWNGAAKMIQHVLLTEWRMALPGIWWRYCHIFFIMWVVRSLRIATCRYFVIQVQREDFTPAPREKATWQNWYISCTNQKQRLGAEFGDVNTPLIYTF
jgi:hypothetical protein